MPLPLINALYFELLKPPFFAPLIVDWKLVVAALVEKLITLEWPFIYFWMFFVEWGIDWPTIILLGVFEFSKVWLRFMMSFGLASLVSNVGDSSYVKLFFFIFWMSDAILSRSFSDMVLYIFYFLKNVCPIIWGDCWIFVKSWLE